MFINLEKMEIPVLTDTKSYSGDYYVPGEDGKWFQHLINYYYNSSLHNSIISNLHRRLQLGYEDDPTFYKISLDYLIFGGYSLQVLWNFNHDKIVYMEHLDYSNCRAGLQDEKGNLNFIYFSNHWEKYNNRKVEVMKTYSEDTISEDNQCFYFRRYNPGYEVYPRPYYIGALRWIATNIELEKYYSSLVKNNFVANSILSINQMMDEDLKKDFEKDLRKHSTGADNAGTMIVMYNENKDNVPIITKFNTDEDDKKYRWLLDKLIEGIAIGHNLPSAILGTFVPGKLGNATDLPIYEKMYNDYVVNPLKNEIVNSYEKLKNKYFPL